MGYDIIYADPPWFYKANSKFGGAATHYPLMSDDELRAFDINQFKSGNSVLFMWATCPRLDFGVDLMREWGFHFRGVAFVWVKTDRTFRPIGARGVPPACTKPTTELVLYGAEKRTGRPFGLLDFKVPQVISAPVHRHSAKPALIRKYIERLYGSDRTRIELFARERAPGWSAFGNQVPESLEVPLLNAC